jgi:uncharacterized protein (TIGR02246 family)
MEEAPMMKIAKPRGLLLAAATLLGAVAVAVSVSNGWQANAATQSARRVGDKVGAPEAIIVFTVRLPPDSALLIDDQKTQSPGEVRTFQTPPVALGKKHVYTLKATSKGKTVTREIHIAFGMDNTFDLRAEFLPAAKGKGTPKDFQVGEKQGGPKGQDGELTGKGKRAQEFIAAFNKGDAKALADFWMPDGDYVDQTGRKYQGRAAIEKLYEKAFAARKGAKLAIFPSSLRKVGDNVALEEGVTEVIPADGGPSTTAAFSAVLVKKDGEWYFESVRESIARPPSNAAHFDDIEWLLGNWVGEEKGESGTASYSWAENRNFIVSSFATTLNGVPVFGGTQWIAWDAVDKKIRSWSFYSGGGFGEAVWTKDGSKWLLKTTAQTAGGKKLSATNVMTKVDDDHVTFQITNLTADGKLLPNPAPLKMKRVKPQP